MTKRSDDVEEVNRQIELRPIRQSVPATIEISINITADEGTYMLPYAVETEQLDDTTRRYVLKLFVGG